MFGDEIVEAGRQRLLDGELHLALFGVDAQHRRLHALARAQHVAGMIQPPVGDDLADVHQALHALGDLDKGAEVHQLGHRAFHLRAHREPALRVEPGIGQAPA